MALVDSEQKSSRVGMVRPRRKVRRSLQSPCIPCDANPYINMGYVDVGGVSILGAILMTPCV